MCGIIGIYLHNNNDDNDNNDSPTTEPAYPFLVDGLTVLQHRGQDAAGIVTSDGRRLHLRKERGLVRDVFCAPHSIALPGSMGLGHCRYPTAGSSSAAAEAQPLYTNTPCGICIVHNGNLTNTQELVGRMQRHLNTDSDSEVLLNWFAEHLVMKKQSGTAATTTTTTKNGSSSSSSSMIDREAIFSAMETVMKTCRGGYAGVILLQGIGLVAFRDPHGIRPLVWGRDTSTNDRKSSVVCSESVALDTLGFALERYV